MIKKTITFTDLNGEQSTEDHYFNLTEAEVIELELTDNGSLSDIIKNIISTTNVQAIYRIMKQVILASYGTRSLDGKNFIKDPKISMQFLSSQAYSEMFIEFMKNPDSTSEFFSKLVPAKIEEKVATPAATPISPEVDAELKFKQEQFEAWQKERDAEAARLRAQQQAAFDAQQSAVRQVETPPEAHQQYIPPVQ